MGARRKRMHGCSAGEQRIRHPLAEVSREQLREAAIAPPARPPPCWLSATGIESNDADLCGNWLGKQATLFHNNQIDRTAKRREAIDERHHPSLRAAAFERLQQDCDTIGGNRIPSTQITRFLRSALVEQLHGRRLAQSPSWS